MGSYFCVPIAHKTHMHWHIVHLLMAIYPYCLCLCPSTKFLAINCLMKKSYFELKQKTQKLCIHTSLCGIVWCAWIEALKQWQNNVGLNTEKYSLVQWNPKFDCPLAKVQTLIPSSQIRMTPNGAKLGVKTMMPLLIESVKQPTTSFTLVDVESETTNEISFLYLNEL